MEAPVAVAAGPETAVVLLTEIAPSPHNPRKHFDEAGLEGLAESIGVKGVQVPLRVRRIPPMLRKGEAIYEIIAGERRWRAAKLAGYSQVPVLIVERSDEEAREERLVENLQREDLTALEEAQGYRDLIDMGKHDVHTLAKKVGKSPSHIYGCLQMLKFPVKIGKALEQGLLPPGHALEIARLATPEQQDLAYQACLGKVTLIADKAEQNQEIHTRALLPLKDLRVYVDRQLKRLLAAAPFKLDDAGLCPKAGACAACRFNTASEAFLKEADLFDHREAAKGAPVCRNGECYDRKVDLHVKRQLAAAKAAGEKVVPISHEASPAAGDGKDWPRDKPVPANLYQEVKPTAKDAVKGVLVDGPAKGKVLSVKLPQDVAVAKGVVKASAPGMPKKGKDQGSAVSGQGNKSPAKTKKDQHEEVKYRRQAFVCDRIQAELEVPAESFPDFIKANGAAWGARLMELVAIFGAVIEHDEKPWESLKKLRGKMVIARNSGERVWEGVVEAFLPRVSYRGMSDEVPLAECYEHAREIAALIGLDWKKLEAEAAKEIPEPTALRVVEAPKLKGQKLKKGEGSRPNKKAKGKK